MGGRASTLILRDYAQIGKDCAFLMRSQWWGEDRIRVYQESGLVRIMRHAVAEVPFYKGLGIGLESIRSAADLSRFPVLTKKDIQDHAKDLIWPESEKESLYSSRTSGTTCEPTTTYFDRKAWLVSKYALKIRRVIAVVNPFRQRLLMFHPQDNVSIQEEDRGRPKGFGFLTVQKHLSLFDPVEQHIPSILDFQPDILSSYPSYLNDLAHAFKKNVASPPVIPVMFTSSEFLAPGWRKAIEQTFQGKIFDVYGTTEFKEVAWQCLEGTYHVNFEHVVLEHRMTGPEDKQNRGPLLVTCLSNLAMPLIRFDVGDVAESGHGKCSCGRSSPQILNIRGREADFLGLPSGNKISPYLLTTAIEKYSDIRQYQIVQISPSELQINVVPHLEGIPNGKLTAIARDLKTLLKEPVSVSVRQTTRITRSPRGKFKIVARPS
jgi:phenylacetate-CoA ligase